MGGIFDHAQRARTDAHPSHAIEDLEFAGQLGTGFGTDGTFAKGGPRTRSGEQATHQSIDGLVGQHEDHENRPEDGEQDALTTAKQAQHGRVLR